MTLLKKVITKVKHTYFRLTLSAEEYFYYNLFVKNQDWNAKTPNEDEQKRWDAILPLVKSVQAGHDSLNILGIGSGRGWLSNLLLPFGKVRGIEPVAVVVKYARRLFPAIEFFAGSVQAFRNAHPSERFHLIVLSEVIEHVPHQEQEGFVKQLNELLTSRGYVIVTTPRKEIIELMPHKPGQPVEDWLSEDELSRLFTSNQFTVGKSARITSVMNSEPCEVYQVWLFQKDS